MKNCQSCGMPLKTPDMLGTCKTGMRIEDYCIYCYKDGEYTEDVTMDEMIQLCARYVEGNSRDVAVVGMKLMYPRLKRWARKEQTQSQYYKSIIRVMEYIQHHLSENTSLNTLAAVANISPFHFHRIFKSTIGESLAEYVQRLRMEYVAEQLKTTGLSLNEIAMRTGYSSEQALSRAFKKYFTVPPRAFKESFFREEFGEELVPRICRMARKNVIVLNQSQPDERSNWQRLYMYAMVNRLLTDTTESLDLISGSQFQPALTTRELLQPGTKVTPFELPDGLYAIFTHKGAFGKIPTLYQAIQNYWIPASKYTKAASPSYIKYLGNPTMMPEEELLAEIYVPVV